MWHFKTPTNCIISAYHGMRKCETKILSQIQLCSPIRITGWNKIWSATGIQWKYIVSAHASTTVIIPKVFKLFDVQNANRFLYCVMYISSAQRRIDYTYIYLFIHIYQSTFQQNSINARAKRGCLPYTKTYFAAARFCHFKTRTCMQQIHHREFCRKKYRASKKHQVFC